MQPGGPLQVTLRWLGKKKTELRGVFRKKKGNLRKPERVEVERKGPIEHQESAEGKRMDFKLERDEGTKAKKEEKNWESGNHSARALR